MSNFHVVAANLIEKDGEFLLVQEGKEDVRGQWNLPAGGVEKDEDIKEAAEREAKEETGLETSLESFVGVFVDESDRSDATVLVFVFHANAKDLRPEVPVSEEIIDVGFFSRAEFEDLEIRVPFLQEAVQRFETGDLKDLNTVEDFR